MSDGQPTAGHGSYDEIVAKAWADDWFKRRLLTDPETVFREHGIEVPPGIRVRVIEDTPEERHVILPARPLDPAAGLTALDTMPFKGWTNRPSDAAARDDERPS